MANSFIENVNTIANATALATGDIVQDTEAARDEAVLAAEGALESEANALVSENLASEWADKGHNNPVTGIAGIDAAYSAYHWAIEAEVFAGDPIINDLVTSASYVWSSQYVNSLLALKASVTHSHTGTYEPVFAKGTAFNKNFGHTTEDVSRGYHLHDGNDGSAYYETNIGTKNTAFNKNFGTIAGTVSEGSHTHTGDYMPYAVEQTGYNKAFVIDSENPLSTEVPRGNHIHKATGISYDSTGNSVIVSSTVQGAVQTLDSILGTIDIIEKAYGTIALDGASRTITILTQNTPTKVDALTKYAGSFKNILSSSSANLTLDYLDAPDNLIEGRFSANLSVEFPSASSEIALTAYVNGLAVHADWSSDVFKTTSDAGTTGTLSLDGYLTGMSNGDYIELYITNVSGTQDIIVKSLTMVFDGSPEGALIAVGLSVAHNDVTGRDVADQHPISSITGLDAALIAKAETSHTHLVTDITDLDLTVKADKIIPAATGNIATLDGTGNLSDSGTLLNALATVNGASTEVFEVATAVLDTQAPTLAQMNSMASSYVTTTTFDTHEGLPNPHNTTHTDVGAAAASHSHAISDTADLQTTLDGKYDEVGAAVTGQLPAFAAGNTLADSGVVAADILVDGDIGTAVLAPTGDGSGLTGLVTTLEDCTDTNIASPGDNQLLAYNNTTGKWIAVDAPASAVWGAVTGTLANQTDLQAALDAKVEPADYASSTVGGTVKMRIENDTLYITNDGSNA